MVVQRIKIMKRRGVLIALRAVVRGAQARNLYGRTLIA